MGKTLFISDLHFSHKNILAFDNRPFKDVQEHDRSLIHRWNCHAEKDDVVWILGDISWCNAEETIKIFEQLNGRKCLCAGNHDAKLLKNKKLCGLFDEICDYKELKIGDTGIVLSHYPIPCFNKHFYGWVHFYGHVHNSFEWNMMERVRYEMEALYDKQCNMINVGCMMPYMNYAPRTAEEIIKRYQEFKKFSSVIK